MSELRVNEILGLLGDKDIYVVVDQASDKDPCVVRAYKESERPQDDAEEIAHRAEPLAEASGTDYREALAALYQKVGN